MGREGSLSGIDVGCLWFELLKLGVLTKAAEVKVAGADAARALLRPRKPRRTNEAKVVSEFNQGFGF